MATATDRNAKLNNPGSDAPEIVAFFEELQTLMTGVGDEYEYKEGINKYPRQWEISSTTIKNKALTKVNGLWKKVNQ